MAIKATRLALVVAGTMAVLTCPAAGELTAQQRDSLQARLTLPSLPMYQPEAPPAPPAVRESYLFPGITITSPTALGAEGQTIYAGASYQERARYEVEDDGAVVAGLGLGDAQAYVGVELSVVSYSTVRSGWFDRMGFGVQVHRALDDLTAVAVGSENLFMINGDESDAGRSFYGVVTRLFPLRAEPTEPFSLITATIGVGNGRFRSENDIFDDRETVGVFGGLSLHVARPVAVLADWSGQDLGVGVSLAPFQRFPFVITPALVDVTETAGDGARFVIGIGIGHRLTSGPIQF